MKHIYIIGSGGFSKQVIEIVEQVNRIQPTYHLVGLIDDKPERHGQQVLGYSVLGDTDYLHTLSEQTEVFAVIAIADGEARRSISHKLLTVHWINLIHPQAIVTRHMEQGMGNIICGGVIINPDCRLGNHCNINIGSTLGHDVVLGDCATIMPGVNLSGNVTVEEGSTVGTGGVVLQGITIGSHSYIGAGAIVLSDVPAYFTAFGAPLQVIKPRVAPSRG